MIKLITETGSVYEVDEENKKVRRLAGVGEPTSRVGKDGTWKEYSNICLTNDIEELNLREGCLYIDWTGVGNCTVTSRLICAVSDNPVNDKWKLPYDRGCDDEISILECEDDEKN